MKNLIFLFIASLFVFFSCEKDIVKHETRDIFVELTAHPDMDIASVQCTPYDEGWIFINGAGWLTGVVSELGSLRKESSRYEMVECYFGPGEYQITEKAIIRMMGTNGDYIDAEGTFILTSEPERPPGFEGYVIITGGSGIYNAAIGSIDIDPASIIFNWQEGSLSWTGSGHIIENGFNKKDNK